MLLYAVTRTLSLGAKCEIVFCGVSEPLKLTFLKSSGNAKTSTEFAARPCFVRSVSAPQIWLMISLMVIINH